jgi:hypothetical protein
VKRSEATRRTPYPPRHAGSEACITVERDGVYLYGNRAAFRTLAGCMSWIARSRPRDHAECHVRFSLDGFSKRPSVWVLQERSLRLIQRRRDFELTFMIVEADDLRRLRRFQKRGLLPKRWRAEPETRTQDKRRAATCRD